MTDTLLVAIIGAITTSLAGFIGAWSSRRNSRDTTANALVSTLVDRMTKQEGSLATLFEKLQGALQTAEEWKQRWHEERDEKHRIQSEGQATVFTYEHAIGDLKEKHALELGEVRACYETALEQIKALKERIVELERHVARLEAGEGAVG